MEELVQLAQRTVADHCSHGELVLVVLIGSYAYPEFARANSDIDLLVVYEGSDQGHGFLTILEHRDVSNKRDVLIEMRLFTVGQVREYALHCELVKQFAFIRGYKILLARSGDAENAIHMCIFRYWTDTYKAFCQIRNLNIQHKLNSIRYQMTDCLCYINDPRLRRYSTLRHLRLAEIIKDFISHVWTLRCAKVAKRASLHCADPKHKLLQSVGLLRVFCEDRGARIIDWEKYSIPLRVKRDVEAINKAVPLGINAVFSAMNALFSREFKRPLILDKHHRSPVVVWR